MNDALNLLDEYSDNNEKENAEDVKKSIISVVKNSGFEIDVVDYKSAPAFTRFFVRLGKNTTYEDINNLQYDLALGVKSISGSVFITKPIPDTDTFGIDVPNKKRRIVSLKSALQKADLSEKPKVLNFPLGESLEGDIETFNISKQPHILMSGAVGGGKSSFLNMMINTIMCNADPEDIKLLLSDVKRVEFYNYDDTPYLLHPVLHDPLESAYAFEWLVNEMYRRYSLFEKARSRNLDTYNERQKENKLPYIIYLIDEFADIMISDPENVEENIVKLAKLSRATGIHLVICTQRPSKELFTDRMRDEIDARICFNVVSKEASKLVIDHEGAEKLLMLGDLIFKAPWWHKLIRAQAPYVSDGNIVKVTEYIKGKEKPDYNQELVKFIKHKTNKSSD